MSTLLVISPGKDYPFGDTVFSLLVAETGERLASHVCSSYGFAKGDLLNGREGFLQKRFGNFEVKFLDETEITSEELLRRNQCWFGGE